MALDSSIYNQSGRVNLGSGLSDILDQQRQRDAMNEQRQNSLASLAMQQQAAQQKQKQQQGQDLNMWLAGAVQSGRPQEEVMQEAIAKGLEIGVAPEVTQRHVASVFGAGATGQDRSRFAAGQAYPQELAKSLFAQPKQERTRTIPVIGPNGQPILVREEEAVGMQPYKATSQAGAQRGQIIFDNQGNAFNVNPYTTEVTPVKTGGKQIQGAQFAPTLQAQIAGSKAEAAKTGGAMGEAIVSLQDIESQMPQLDKLVTDLSALGKKATYTIAGQASDAVRRQLGMEVGESAVARKEYISKVDNEVLPLLRQTFGAAFTVKEGESLRATLGDPDVSPEEKDAVLRSFIETKREQIASLGRRTGRQTSQPQAQAGQDAEAIAWAQANPNDPRAAQIMSLHGR